MTLARPRDSFWNSDLDAIESTFLGKRKITDLPIHLDPRVPPQGRVELDRTVNVDSAVQQFLKNTNKPANHIGLLSRLFDKVIFG